MKKTLMLSMAATAVIMAGGDIQPVEPVVEAPATTDFGIFSNVKFNGELRTRYESVDYTTDGDLLTTRFALSAGADIAAIDGLSVFGQVMAVSDFGWLDSGVANPSGPATLIADPQQSRLTQAYLNYNMGDTDFKAGRQMINIDDERFVGAVGWRQMPQTFTAYTLTNSSIENLNLMASYVTKRLTIKDVPTVDADSVFLHADYQVLPELKLTGYGYLIGEDANAVDGDTYGLMASGKVGMINYIGEVATQQDPSMGNSTATVDAMYYRVDLSTKLNGFILGAAYESMDEAGAGNTHGFVTPYATLHKWQGFADVFLGYTGAGNTYGLEDAYVKVGYADPTYGTLVAFYHDFSTKTAATDFTDDAGSEIDLVYTYDYSKNLSFMAKAAFFSGDATSSVATARADKDIFWVMVDYKF